MIPHLVNCGFHYHHALSDTAVLLKWLPSEEECPIPPFCHTMIGVGGIVVDEEDNILTVQEKFQQKKYWKLPGGYVEPGEDLGDAAIREVFEETGIKTEFRSVLGMRHVHGFNFDSSDMYFIVQLAPLNKETVRCEKEILDVKWMPIAEYMEHPQVHALNRSVAAKYLECKEKGVFFGCTERLNPINFKKNLLYFIEFEESMNSSKSSQVENGNESVK
ncbi:hypothetical protein QYM36_005561 [Artemia franciscana]|nr:hypothetical protein QYM36_005561 [Artemia franciscana]